MVESVVALIVGILVIGLFVHDLLKKRKFQWIVIIVGILFVFGSITSIIQTPAYSTEKMLARREEIASALIELEENHQRGTSQLANRVREAKRFNELIDEAKFYEDTIFGFLYGDGVASIYYIPTDKYWEFQSQYGDEEEEYVSGTDIWFEYDDWE